MYCTSGVVVGYSSGPEHITVQFTLLVLSVSITLKQGNTQDALWSCTRTIIGVEGISVWDIMGSFNMARRHVSSSTLLD